MLQPTFDRIEDAILTLAPYALAFVAGWLWGGVFP